MLTSLRRTEVFAGSWSAWASTTGLLDAESPALIHLTLERILGGIGGLSGVHLHEPEATALTSVWVTHNVALLDIAVLPEEFGDLLFGETWVDARDEEVGAGVGRTALSSIVLVGLAVVVVACEMLVGKSCDAESFTYASARPLVGSSRTRASLLRSGPGERERSRP